MLLFKNFNNKPKFYFIGIGGISMSALAKYLLTCGFEVSGSDKNSTDQTKMLESLGCKINYNHLSDDVLNFDIVVYNSAINFDNEEIIKAKSANKIMFSRLDLLNVIMREFSKSVGICGAHGKTTTTALIANILLYSEIDFTSHIGGFDKTLGNMFIKGKDVFVTEVCEFQRNIDKLTNTISVTLNIDNDHLNSYKDFDDLKNSFYEYINRSKISIINADDKNLQGLKGNLITFGKMQAGKSYDYSFKILTNSKATNESNFRIFYKNKKLFDVKNDLFFSHDGYNILAATAVCRELGISEKTIQYGLKNYCGILRRNEFLGQLFTMNVWADYAHHPSEIKSSIDNFKLKLKNLLVIFQPHTFSRTKLLFDDFVSVLSNVENLWLYKTYPARETEEAGYDAKYLAEKLNSKLYFDTFDELCRKLRRQHQKFENVLILGAGDLYDKVKLLIK